MKVSSIFFILGFCLTFALTKKLPKHYPKCQPIKSDADVPIFEECFKAMAMTWREYFKKGIPELRIPSLEPFTIPLIMVEQSGSVSYVLKFHNTVFHHLTNYTMDYFKFQKPPVVHMNGTVTYTNLKMIGNYEIDGSIAGIRFKGQGPWNANISDVLVSAYITGELYTKKRERYLKVSKLDTNANIGNAQMKMENFFGTNDVLNKIFNDFLRDYSDDVMESLKPDIQKIIVKVFKQVEKQLAARVPYDEMFISS